jgi:hypothetical protein
MIRVKSNRLFRVGPGSLKTRLFLIDIVQIEASNESSFIDLSPKNVDPSALPAVYGDARILAGGLLDRLGDKLS